MSDRGGLGVRFRQVLEWRVPDVCGVFFWNSLLTRVTVLPLQATATSSSTSAPWWAHTSRWKAWSPTWCRAGRSSWLRGPQPLSRGRSALWSWASCSTWPSSASSARRCCERPSAAPPQRRHTSGASAESSEGAGEAFGEGGVCFVRFWVSRLRFVRERSSWGPDRLDQGLSSSPCS